MRIEIPFHPKLGSTLQDYSRQNFMADIVAGITAGIVALPLAMALAVASGVKPEAGILTAVIEGFLISALGGSRAAMGRPPTQPLLVMDKSGFLDRIGRGNVCAHIDAALERARKILGRPPASPPEPDLEHVRKLELKAARQEIAMAFKRADEALGWASGRTTTLPRSVEVSTVLNELVK